MNTKKRNHDPDIILTDENIKSAIIGYWRSGASYQEISEIISMPQYYVKRIIDEYKFQLDKLNT